ncbi:MAG TPA: hypothetical protein VD948_12540 [Rhodothermales bacterium]|nr:hypothetical protein [Rhodothermales bacterium]HYF09185.1 hypothetical protein [Acetobacteraceae bacterium]
MSINAAAFGPDTTRSAKTGLGLADLANKGASAFGFGSPTLSTGIGLAQLGVDIASDPTPSGVTGTLGKAATGALRTASMNASSLPLDLGALGSTSVSPMALWNIPQLAGGLVDLFDPVVSAENARRGAQRSRDAMQLQSEILGPLSGALRGERGWREALDAPVGGVRVGDALVSALDNNLTGTWYADTEHNWRPNPGYRGLRALLGSAGYERRDPTANNVGGMGEIVMGAGHVLVPQSYQSQVPHFADRGYEQSNPYFTGRGPLMNEYSEGAVMPVEPQGYRGGSVGWDLLLRTLGSALGTPVGTPNTFEFTDAPITHAQAIPEVGEGGAGSAPARMGPDPNYTAYMSALAESMPDAHAVVSAADARRAGQRESDAWVRGGGGTG